MSCACSKNSVRNESYTFNSSASGATLAINRARKCCVRASMIWAPSRPSLSAFWIYFNTAGPSPLCKADRNLIIQSLLTRPMSSSTTEGVISPLAMPTHWSRILNASRKPPSAWTAMRRAALSSKAKPSLSATYCNRCAISSDVIRLNVYRWQRDTMVTGSFSISVVAKMNITWSGGSSIVFNRAFHASLVSIWASSMMNTFLRPSTGINFTLSRKARISSIPRFDAASISRTSIDWPLKIDLHTLHSLQGWSVGPCSQLMARAKILAILVLPVPRGPANR